MGLIRTTLLLAVSSVVLLACGAASVDEGDSASAEALASGDPAYPEDAEHSTLTPAIVARLKTVLASSSGDTHRFAKVGDSITLSTAFLDCLSTSSVASSAANLEATRTYFAESTGRTTAGATETSWNRTPDSAVVGWHTLQPITGSPSPVDNEVAAMNPAFAVVMLGTNDNDPSQVNGCSGSGETCAYRANLEKVVDALLGKNIVPLLSTIPPRGNSAEADARVPAMNAIVRFVAAERQIPLMDFHLALQGLPLKGLGPDGIHPNAASSGACDFSANGLTHGYNVRNKLVLEALDQVRAALLGAGDAPSDPTTAPVAITDPETPDVPADPSVAAPGPIPDNVLTAVDDYTVLASALNCRSAAGTDQSVVELVANGATLTAMADSTDAPREEMVGDAPWLHVTTPSGATCYVSADSSLINPIF